MKSLCLYASVKVLSAVVFAYTVLSCLDCCIFIFDHGYSSIKHVFANCIVFSEASLSQRLCIQQFFHSI